jgi:phosphoglycerate dehydrogenase-like enzyme
MNIYIAFPLDEDDRRRLLEAVLPEDVCSWAQDLPEAQRLNAFMQAEVVFGNVPADWLQKNDRLKWVQLYSAGFDQYLDLDWKHTLASLTVSNLRGFFGQPVAETALAGILALYRKINELVRLQEKTTWVGGRLRPQMELLHEKNALVLGAGAIGDTTRKLLEGFSCSVQIISRQTDPTLADLDQLLPEADIIVSCLPDTLQTQRIFDANRFQLMKKTAVLVNVGRGGAVDEKALLQALRQCEIGGAVLDVTWQEPLPADHPFWALPNVILTQHTGGGYMEENMDKVKVFVENLRRYRSGEPVENQVDFGRGY